MTSIVIDFDGTITTTDVGDDICDRFGPPDWRDLDAAWDRGEISLPDAQRQMWATIRVSRQAILAFVAREARLRDGFDAFLADVGGARLVLASGGFDLYIQPILQERLSRFDAAYFNTAEPGPGGVAVGFPHAEARGCRLCAVCKGRVCEEERQAGRRVVYIGDGVSDRCAIGVADAIWAVRGSKLAADCASRGVAHRTFDTFAEIDWRAG